VQCQAALHPTACYYKGEEVKRIPSSPEPREQSDVATAEYASLFRPTRAVPALRYANAGYAGFSALRALLRPGEQNNAG